MSSTIPSYDASTTGIRSVSGSALDQKVIKRRWLWFVTK